MGAFSLLIVLFWGSVLIYRLIKERVATKQYDRERDADFNAREIAMRRWMLEVCDDELEEEIEEYVHDIGNRAEVRRIVLSSFEEAGMTSSCYDEKDAIRVMLAKQGKLRRHDAKYGILVRPLKTESTTTREHKNSILNRRKFILWIDSKLKEHGINEKIYVNTTSFCYFTVDSDEYRCGYYTWSPVIFPKYVKNL